LGDRRDRRLGRFFAKAHGSPSPRRTAVARSSPAAEERIGIPASRIQPIAPRASSLTSPGASKPSRDRSAALRMTKISTLLI
jgi:hypothetical protein